MNEIADDFSFQPFPVDTVYQTPDQRPIQGIPH